MKATISALAELELNDAAPLERDRLSGQWRCGIKLGGRMPTLIGLYLGERIPVPVWGMLFTVVCRQYR